MKFTMRIDLNNAAWRDEDDEISLAALAEAIKDAAEVISDDDTGIIRDANGNSCGVWNIA
jgi:hypothetical protein